VYQCKVPGTNFRITYAASPSSEFVSN
jgi:hypothetical protein